MSWGKWTQLSRKNFFDKLSNTLGLKSLEDWYNITVEDIHKHGGEGSPRSYYNGSPSKALQNIYPNHNWMPWRFSTVPQGYWDSIKNQQQFFDWLGVKRGNQNMDDWYDITIEDVAKNGGGGLMAYYNTSPSKALQNVYPEHRWMLWRFKVLPKAYWDSLQTSEAKRMTDWLGEQLFVKTLEDWYRISLHQIHKWIWIRSSTQFCSILQIAYPQHNWVKGKLHSMGKSTKASQRQLRVEVQKLFPQYDVEEDYKHPKMVHGSGESMELDVYIEDLKLGFEYQGEQHYKPLHWTRTDLETQKTKDEEKELMAKQVCRTIKESFCKHGVTLVSVPYWWDFDKESLAATIQQIRPELISTPVSANPIPVTPPNT